jgi:uncharacterized protein
MARGEYFEAHDALEPAWKEATGDLKTALQGLIQIAAGLHKRSRGESAGAAYLLARGAEKVRRAKATLPSDITALFLDAAAPT